MCQLSTLQLADVHVVLQWRFGQEDLGLHYPKEFQDIVNQCLSIAPADRPTMRQVIELLLAVPLTGDANAMVPLLVKVMTTFGCAALGMHCSRFVDSCCTGLPFTCVQSSSAMLPNLIVILAACVSGFA